MAAVFIDQFRNLPGLTLGEKKRNLNSLFNASAGSSPIVLAQIAEQLKPETALDRLFYTEFLLHFRLFPQLYRQFLDCDGLTLAKVAREPWFFQRVFEQIGAEFVTELFPKLGHRLKLKLFNKIALSEAQADAIYDVVSDKYGEGLALQVLTKCSAGKIEALIKRHHLKLWPAHLHILYEKNPQLIYEYFDEIARTEGAGHVQTLFYELKPLARHIAKTNIEMFLDMKERYKLDGKLLGKRTALKLVESKRADMVEHPEKYLHNLNNPKIVRKLGKDFRSVYSKLFPRDLNLIYAYNPGVTLLKSFAKKGRGGLFMQTFKQVFGDDIKPASITDQMLSVIPDGEFREALAKIKIENGQIDGDDCEAFVKFYKASRCFDTMKKRWNFATSSSQRSDYGTYIVEACILNEDYETLALVLEFIAVRMRNDDVYAKYRVLLMFSWPRVDFNKLDGRHWKSLVELASSVVESYEHQAMTVLFRYVFHYAIKEKGQADVLQECFKFFKKDIKLIFGYAGCAGPSFDKEDEKGYLNFFLGKTPPPAIGATQIDEYNKALVLACIDYNKRHKDDPIVLETQFLCKMSTAEGLNISELYDVALKKPHTQELARVYWSNLTNTCSLRNINWFLRHKPQDLVQNFEAFVDVLKSRPEWNDDFHNNWKLWKDFKYYSFLDLDQKALHLCSDKLQDRDHWFWLPLPLSVLSTDYPSLMQAFKPTSDTNDDEDELNFQKKLIKHLKNACIVSIPNVLEFCRGDYLAEALIPLRSALYKLPEDQTQPHLEALQKTGAVSVKKHGLYLSCVLLDQTSAIKAIKSSKLQPQSLTSALKYFQRNPTDAAFDVVKLKLPKVNKNDKFTNKLIVDVVAATDYRGRYFDLAWSVLNETGNVQWKKVLLTKAKQSTLSRLTPATLTKIIESDFMKAPKMDEFTTNVLIQSSNHEPVYEALQRFKTTQWDDDVQSRKKLSEFIDTFFYAYMTQIKTDLELIETFGRRLQAIFKPFEAYEELLLVNLMRFKGQPLESLASSIVELNNNLIAQYGQGALDAFAVGVKKLLVDKWGRPFCPKSDADKFKVLRKILDGKQSLDDVLLVVKLLPETEPQDAGTAEVYNDLMVALEDIEEESVKLHLNLYLKSSDCKGGKRRRRDSESDAGVPAKRLLLPTKKR